MLDGWSLNYGVLFSTLRAKKTVDGNRGRDTCSKSVLLSWISVKTNVFNIYKLKRTFAKRGNDTEFS